MSNDISPFPTQPIYKDERKHNYNLKIIAIAIFVANK